MPEESERDRLIESAPYGEDRRSWIKSPAGLAFGVFMAAIAYFLVTEHLAHTIAVLPWAILALCPFMHFFMHRGHGGGGRPPGDRS